MAPQWKAKIMFKKLMMAGLMSATILGGIAPAYAQRGDDGGWRGRAEQQRPRTDGGRSGGDGQRWQNREVRQQRDSGDRAQQRRDQRPAARVAQPQPRPQWQGDGRRESGARSERQQSWGAAPQRQENRQYWRNSRPADGRDDNRRDNDRRDNDRRDNDRRGGEWRGGEWRGNDRRGDNRWNNDDRRWSENRRFDDRTRWSGQRRWDNGWRQDRRYDWRSYRSRYGDRYRIGRYYAPRGWNYGYRRYSIGIFLNSLLFTNSYWIDDPWSYRLPPAYGTLRWVRYYDDALLVDIRDGYVVDVIHGFFW